MPIKKKETTSTTIRLDAELRIILESIAGRENRSLSGQMTQFLSESCARYMAENALSYYPNIHEVATADEHNEYLHTDAVTVYQDELKDIQKEYRKVYGS